MLSSLVMPAPAPAMTAPSPSTWVTEVSTAADENAFVFNHRDGDLGRDQGVNARRSVGADLRRSAADADLNLNVLGLVSRRTSDVDGLDTARLAVPQ